MTELSIADFTQWRSQARLLLSRQQDPDRVHFMSSEQAQPLLGLQTSNDAAPTIPSARVPKDFFALAEAASCYRDPDRWNLLYRLAWRLTHGEAGLLNDHSDPLVRKLRLMEKAVRRDIHKTHAFVRFRESGDGTFVAWHRPAHLTVRLSTPFFARRFGGMRWCILTPDECAYWDLTELRFGPGLTRDAAPAQDDIEPLWLAYYSSIFNPARLNLPAMMAEMPAHHWSTLPEAQLIGELTRTAATRVSSMMTSQPASAKPFVPAQRALPVLREAALSCQGCELYQHASQTVFGEGPSAAPLMLVGEQPGDQEDLTGQPFAGPAGQLLNRALQDAGIDRAQTYITNAVKHFHFEERGKRRIHKKPRGTHISACRPWLEAEIETVRPRVIVCLGATAAQSLLGREVRVLSERGQWLDNRWAAKLLVTVHPSALLRLPDRDAQEREYAKFVADLELAAEATRTFRASAV